MKAPIAPERSFRPRSLCKVGPGPMAAIRFKWTVRRADDGGYYVDETIGENSAPVVTGPMSRDAAVKLVDDLEAEAQRRFRGATQRNGRTRRGGEPGPQGTAKSGSLNLPARRSQKIHLDEFDAPMARDVVGRRYVKEELRHAEREQQRLAGVNFRVVPFLKVKTTSKANSLPLI